MLSPRLTSTFWLTFVLKFWNLLCNLAIPSSAASCFISNISSAVEIRQTCRTIRHFLWMFEKNVGVPDQMSNRKYKNIHLVDEKKRNKSDYKVLSHRAVFVGTRSTLNFRCSIFSSPEPKARVSYCHSAPSVVRPSVRRPSSSVNFHIFDFFSRTTWWILMKLGRDEVLMVPYKCCCFSARSPQGRIQGGAKIGLRGSPSSRNFFFRPEGYSDKPNA